MTLSQLLLFVVSALYLALAVFVYRAGRQSPIHRWFAAFVACAAAWTFGIAGRLWGTHLEAWNDLAFASASLLSPTFYGFTYVFATRTSRPPHWTVVASLVLGGLLAVLSAATSLVYYDPVMTPEGFARNSGPLYPAFAIYCLLGWMLALGTLFAKWRGARGVSRVQLGYVGWAFLISGLGGMTTNLVLPWFTGRSTYSWFGPYFGVVLIGLIAHTIIRHRLMDLRLVIHRGLAGGVAAFLALIPVAVLVGLVWPRLAEHLNRGELAVLMAAVFAVGLLSPLARGGAAGLLDRYVYRTHANYQRTVRKASTMLTRVLNMDDFIAVLTRTLRDAVRPEGLALYAARHGQLLCVAGERSLETVHFGLPAEFPPAIADGLGRTKDVLATDHSHATPNERSVLHSMHELNWAVVLPLLAEDTLIGAIGLGPKRSGDPFYRDDLNLLMTLANQAGVALQNAQRYAEVVVAHEYVARIVASISSGVVAVSRAQHITLFNDAAAKLTGLPRADVDNRDTSVLPRPLAEALSAAVQNGEVVSVPEAALRHHPTSLRVTLTASPVRDQSGATVGAVSVFSDLMPVRELELERRKAEKVAYFEMLASGIAHEVKNPLVAIKTFVQLLPRRQNDREWIENFGRVATTEIARIEKLLERLRTLSQPTVRPRIRVDLRASIAEAVDFLKPLVAENGIKLDVTLPPEAVVIVADHDGLKQLILNLLSNAQEATPPGGAISVELNSVSNVAELIVTDTGEGIAPELLERIFDPFVTTKPQGTGLGLAISAAMAALHGGTLRAASSSAGGARFTLTLPLAPVALTVVTA